jgi:hypothetical protein
MEMNSVFLQWKRMACSYDGNGWRVPTMKTDGVFLQWKRMACSYNGNGWRVPNCFLNHNSNSEYSH